MILNDNQLYLLLATIQKEIQEKDIVENEDTSNLIELEEIVKAELEQFKLQIIEASPDPVEADFYKEKFEKCDDLVTKMKESHRRKFIAMVHLESDQKFLDHLVAKRLGIEE